VLLTTKRSSTHFHPVELAQPNAPRNLKEKRVNPSVNKVANFIADLEKMELEVSVDSNAALRTFYDKYDFINTQFYKIGV